MSKSKRFLQAWTVVIAAWACSLFLPEKSSWLFAQSFPPGHWQHINILDFGGGLDGLAGDQQATVIQWFADHIDLAEATGATPALRGANLNMKTFTYNLDISACQHESCAYNWPLDATLDNLPEDYFLHVADTTTVDLYRFGEFALRVTIPGCPSPLPITKLCRLESSMWEDNRWTFNPKNGAFRNWMADKLLREAPYEGVFLDEHGAGFARALGFWEGDTELVSGGAIREYGGLPIGTEPFETQYNTDLSSALAFYHSTLAASGKFLFVNTAGYSTDPLGIAQVMGAKGVHTETMHRPDVFDGPDDYAQFVRMVQDVAAAGGLADLFGSTCYWGPDKYTSPGNFSTSSSRYLMWRLASYYLMKEPVGSPGRVYFDPSLCVGSGTDIIQEWQKGYEFDVGQPSGPYSRQQVGGATIFRREYTKATILVRAQDCWNCEDYGDSSAVTVNLGTPVHVLNGEGQLSAPTSSVRVRNAEALVLIKP